MMKLSLTLDPNATFASDCAAAQQLGFDAVVVRLGSGRSASVERAHRDIAEAGLCIAGLHLPIVWSGHSGEAVDAARRAIDSAVEWSAPSVGPVEAEAGIGRTASSAVAPFRGWAAPVGEYAGDRKVKLLLGNAGLFATARALWVALDQLPRQTFGCDWDLHRAVAAGDAASVAVPMLNLRLHTIQLGGMMGPEPRFSRLAIAALHRLAGIGFNGFLNIDVPPRFRASADQRQAFAARAVEQVRAWMTAGPGTVGGVPPREAPAEAAGASSNRLSR